MSEREPGKILLFAKFNQPEQVTEAIHDLEDSGFSLDELDLLVPENDASEETGPAQTPTEKRRAWTGALVGASLGILIIGGVFTITALSLYERWAIILILFGVLVGALTGVEFGPLVALRTLRQSHHQPQDPVEPLLVLAVHMDEMDKPERVAETRSKLSGHGAREVISNSEQPEVEENIFAKWKKIDHMGLLAPEP